MTVLRAEWTDESKTWGELTDAEKGALLLAHHRGETIQFHLKLNDWSDTSSPSWTSSIQYRTKPKPKVKVKTVPVSCYVGDSTWVQVGTIDLIDGKPDLTSLKARADE